MKKAKKRIIKYKDFTFHNIAILIASILMITYLVFSISPLVTIGRLAPPLEATAEISLLNSQFINNALIINISAPEIIAVSIINLRLPDELNVNMGGITGTGAFETINIREKREKIMINYFDMTPSDYEGSLIIPFSATIPGEYDIQVLGRTRFFTKTGQKIEITLRDKRIILKMFNFSFYVTPTFGGEMNKVPVGSFGDAVINTTIPGTFAFNLITKHNTAILNRTTAISIQQPTYTWTESFDSYLHPENIDACNAGNAETSIKLNYSNNIDIVENNIEVELTKPTLSDIYRIVDKYFENLNETLIPRAYYMVGSYFNCP